MFLVTLQGSGGRKSILLWAVSFISLWAVHKLFTCRWPFPTGSSICVCYQNECMGGPLVVTLVGVGAACLAWKNCLGIEGSVYMRDKSSLILMGSCPWQSGKRQKCGRRHPLCSESRLTFGHLFIQPSSSSTTKMKYGLDFSKQVTHPLPLYQASQRRRWVCIHCLWLQGSLTGH